MFFSIPSNVGVTKWHEFPPRPNFPHDQMKSLCLQELGISNKWDVPANIHPPRVRAC